ncbi:flagellar biosynthesis anti-sigma factor FlgM [Scandinavium sp.]|uniref:flagellar biosynthesis anti-sigma factor FlgM n=1 Tax=Scandinavium sp. TaxID=2830653 RepID=UPI0028A2BC71|nr:flagellar biosynthesis anti-sigma factor FlgM [Scandinavium sp.]
MSIDRTQHALPVTAVNAHQDFTVRAKTENVSTQSVTTDKDTGTNVKLSQMAQQIQADDSQDIDHARIDKIRQAMEAGELTFDTDKIAQALVNDIFQLS